MKRQKAKSTIPHVKYYIDMYKEGNHFIGIARGLSYTGVGKTIDEAIKNTNKSVRLALEWCYRKKTLSIVLKEAGFEPIVQDGNVVWDNRNYLGSFQSKVVA